MLRLFCFCTFFLLPLFSCPPSSLQHFSASVFVFSRCIHGTESGQSPFTEPLLSLSTFFAITLLNPSNVSLHTATLSDLMAPTSLRFQFIHPSIHPSIHASFLVPCGANPIHTLGERNTSEKCVCDCVRWKK